MEPAASSSTSIAVATTKLLKRSGAGFADRPAQRLRRRGAEKKHDAPRLPSVMSLVFPEGGVQCPEGHDYEKCTENPPGYVNQACCDFCGLPSLPLERGEFFHCDKCKFDSCPECAATAVRYNIQGEATSGTMDSMVEVRQEMNVVNASQENHHARVWTSAPALARYIQETPELVNNSEQALVLELGAGSALASLVLAKLRRYRAIVVTDLSCALPLASEGFRHNLPQAVEAEGHGAGGSSFVLPSSAGSSEQQVLVRPLDWTAAEEGVEKLRAEASSAQLPPPSLILAADVAYDRKLVAPFLDTLVALRDKWVREDTQQQLQQQRQEEEENVCPRRVTLLMAHEPRGMGVDSVLQRGLRARGIRMERVVSEAVRAEGRGRVELLRATL